MKVVIFAGGLGTRLSEETNLLPKPMIEINGRPILWHIMQSYSAFGYSEFVILLGYKSYLIKEYFAHYCLHNSDVEIDCSSNSIRYLSPSNDPWKITLLDTGVSSLTGTRLLMAKKYLNSTFMLTYGDGLSDLDMVDQLRFHRSHGGLCTFASVQPAGRFGTFVNHPDSTLVKSFTEKPAGDGSWINGGFFICEPAILDFIPSDINVAFEDHPLQDLSLSSQLHSYRHTGFWKCMDTLRDKVELNRIALSNPVWLH